MQTPAAAMAPQVSRGGRVRAPEGSANPAPAIGSWQADQAGRGKQMNQRQTVTQNPAGKRDEAARETEQVRDARRRLMRRCVWGGGLLVAAVTLAVVFIACGSNDQGTVQHASETTVAPVGYPSPAPQVAATPAEPSPIGRVSRDSLPPEIRAHARYTTVSPGGVIEVEAEASPDVASMVLDDGYGHKQAFARDSASGVWRAYCRAPMRSVERLGLAVTGKNGVERWRRVWVFVRVEPDQATEPADSSGDESGKP